MDFRFRIPGKPVPKLRPRIGWRGRKPCLINPQTEIENWYRSLLIGAIGPVRPIFTGPVVTNYEFCFKRPKSHFKKSGGLKKGAPEQHTQKPDLDNLIKFINDCCNKIIFKDDTQIVLDYSIKLWTPGDAETLIVIREFKR